MSSIEYKNSFNQNKVTTEVTQFIIGFQTQHCLYRISVNPNYAQRKRGITAELQHKNFT